MNKATEKMCQAARMFILGLNSGIYGAKSMKEHLEACNDDPIPDRLIEMIKTMGPKAHLTKWDQADIIYTLMETQRCNDKPATLEPLMEELHELQAIQKYAKVHQLIGAVKEMVSLLEIDEMKETAKNLAAMADEAEEALKK